MSLFDANVLARSYIWIHTINICSNNKFRHVCLNGPENSGETCTFQLFHMMVRDDPISRSDHIRSSFSVIYPEIATRTMYIFFSAPTTEKQSFFERGYPDTIHRNYIFINDVIIYNFEYWISLYVALSFVYCIATVIGYWNSIEFCFAKQSYPITRLIHT